MCVSEFPAAGQLASQFYKQCCNGPHNKLNSTARNLFKGSNSGKVQRKGMFFKALDTHQITQTIFGKLLPSAGVDESECD